MERWVETSEAAGEKEREREQEQQQRREMERRLEVVRSNKNFNLLQMYYIDITQGFYYVRINEDNIILKIKKNTIQS